MDAVSTPPPVGWVAVCRSEELARGAVRTAECGGTAIAVWRGEDGIARAINAACGHNRIDMTAGGKVVGNLLECPAHLWRWDGDGACREIPHAPRVPPAAQRKDCVPSWPTREAGGQVLVWHPPDREAPLWPPPECEGEA